MSKPKILKGLSYSFPEQGLMAIYVPNDELQGSKLYILKLTPQTQPIAYVLKRLIDASTKPNWYTRLINLYHKPTPAAEVIDEKLGKQPETKEEAGSHGRVIKAKAPATYTPDRPKGGRVTKVMPKSLQKIKEAQEAAVED